jgi:predicted aspartyl protease
MNAIRSGLAGWVAAAMAVAPCAASLAAAGLPGPAGGDKAPAGLPPVYVAATRVDQVGRIMAPVYVNGQGPFAFVVDTGASRSAIAPRLARELELLADPTRMMTLRGVTGAAEVPSLRLARLQVGDLVFDDLQVPVVQPGIFAEADGILGVEGLERACLQADFVRQTFQIGGDGCPQASEDWLRVRADLRFGGLLAVKGRVKRVPVKVIIDTGAERSLGNLALLDALNLPVTVGNSAEQTEVLGATAHAVPGRTLVVPSIEVGGMTVKRMRVTFGDFDVFALWSMDDGPALLLGMDVLGTSDALMVDYRRRELLILPAGSQFTVRTGTRLPATGRLP